MEKVRETIKRRKLKERSSQIVRRKWEERKIENYWRLKRKRLRLKEKVGNLRVLNKRREKGIVIRFVCSSYYKGR